MDFSNLTRLAPPKSLFTKEPEVPEVPEVLEEEQEELDLKRPETYLLSSKWVNAKSVEERVALVDRIALKQLEALEADKEGTIEMEVYRKEADGSRSGKPVRDQVKTYGPDGLLSRQSLEFLEQSRQTLLEAAQDPDGGVHLNGFSGKLEASNWIDQAVRGNRAPAEDDPSLKLYDEFIKDQSVLATEETKPDFSWEKYVKWSNDRQTDPFKKVDPEDKKQRRKFGDHVGWAIYDPTSMGPDKVIDTFNGRVVVNPTNLFEYDQVERELTERTDLTPAAKKLAWMDYEAKVNQHIMDGVNLFASADAGVEFLLGDFASPAEARAMEEKIKGWSDEDKQAFRQEQAAKFSGRMGLGAKPLVNELAAHLEAGGAGIDFLRANKKRMSRDSYGPISEWAAKTRDAFLATGGGVNWAIGHYLNNANPVAGIMFRMATGTDGTEFSRPAQEWGILAEETAQAYRNPEYDLLITKVNRRDLTSLGGQLTSFIGMGSLGIALTKGATLTAAKVALAQGTAMATASTATRLAAATGGRLGPKTAAFLIKTATDPTAYLGAIQASGMSFGGTHDAIFKKTGDAKEAYRVASIDAVADGLGALIATSVMNRVTPGAERLFGLQPGKAGGSLVQRFRSTRANTAGARGLADIKNSLSKFHPKLGKQFAKDMKAAVRHEAAQKGLRGFGAFKSMGAEGIEEFSDEAIADVIRIIVDDSKSWSAGDWGNIHDNFRDYLKAGVLGMIGGAVSDAKAMASSGWKATVGNDDKRKAEIKRAVTDRWAFIKADVAGAMADKDTVNPIYDGTDPDALKLAAVLASEDPKFDLKYKSRMLVAAARKGAARPFSEAVEDAQEDGQEPSRPTSAATTPSTAAASPVVPSGGSSIEEARQAAVLGVSKAPAGTRARQEIEVEELPAVTLPDGSTLTPLKIGEVGAAGARLSVAGPDGSVTVSYLDATEAARLVGKTDKKLRKEFEQTAKDQLQELTGGKFIDAWTELDNTKASSESLKNPAEKLRQQASAKVTKKPATEGTSLERFEKAQPPGEVRFFPKSHVYKNKEGVSLPSVTTLKGQSPAFAFNEKEALKQAAKKLGITEREVKEMWDEKKESGTALHKLVEESLKSGTKSTDPLVALIVELVTTGAKGAVLSEVVVSTNTYAGTIDILVPLADGTWRLMDIKTLDENPHEEGSKSSERYKGKGSKIDSWAVQLLAYKAALEARGLVVSEMKIIPVNRDSREVFVDSSGNALLDVAPTAEVEKWFEQIFGKQDDTDQGANDVAVDEQDPGAKPEGDGVDATAEVGRDQQDAGNRPAGEGSSGEAAPAAAAEVEIETLDGGAKLVSSDNKTRTYEIKGPNLKLLARFSFSKDKNGIWRPTPGIGFEIFDKSLRGQGLGEKVLLDFANRHGTVASSGINAETGTSNDALKMWRRITDAVISEDLDPEFGGSKGYVYTPAAAEVAKYKPLPAKERRQLFNEAEDIIKAKAPHAQLSLRERFKRIKRRHDEARQELENATTPGDKRRAELDMMEAENAIRSLVGLPEVDTQAPITEEDQRKEAARRKAVLDELDAKIARGEPLTDEDRKAWVMEGRKKEDLPSPSTMEGASTPSIAVTEVKPGVSTVSQLAGRPAVVAALAPVLASGGNVDYAKNRADAEDKFGLPPLSRTTTPVARAYIREDGTTGIVLFPAALALSDEALAKVIEHERIHLEQFAFENTKEGQAAAAKGETSFIKGHPEFDAKLDGLMRKEYPSWDKLSPRSKLREATRAVIEGLTTGETSHFKPGFFSYLKAFLKHLQQVFKDNSAILDYVNGVAARLKASAAPAAPGLSPQAIAAGAVPAPTRGVVAAPLTVSRLVTRLRYRGIVFKTKARDAGARNPDNKDRYPGNNDVWMQANNGALFFHPDFLEKVLANDEITNKVDFVEATVEAVRTGTDIPLLPEQTEEAPVEEQTEEEQEAAAVNETEEVKAELEQEETKLEELPDESTVEEVREVAPQLVDTATLAALNAPDRESFLTWLKGFSKGLSRFGDKIWRAAKGMAVALAGISVAPQATKHEIASVAQVSPELVEVVSGSLPNWAISSDVSIEAEFSDGTLPLPLNETDNVAALDVSTLPQPALVSIDVPQPRQVIKNVPAPKVGSVEATQSLIDEMSLGNVGTTLPGGLAKWWLKQGKNPAVNAAAALLGEHEKGSSRIKSMLVSMGVSENPSSFPWCSAFLSWSLNQAGLKTKTMSSRAFLGLGQKTTAPAYGDVVVLWNDNPATGGKDGWGGHTGFYLGETDTHVIVLSGNSGDSVDVSAFVKTRVLGYRTFGNTQGMLASRGRPKRRARSGRSLPPLKGLAGTPAQSAPAVRKIRNLSVTEAELTGESAEGKWQQKGNDYLFTPAKGKLVRLAPGEVVQIAGSDDLLFLHSVGDGVWQFKRINPEKLSEMWSDGNTRVKVGHLQEEWAKTRLDDTAADVEGLLDDLLGSDSAPKAKLITGLRKLLRKVMAEVAPNAAPVAPNGDPFVEVKLEGDDFIQARIETVLVEGFQETKEKLGKELARLEANPELQQLKDEIKRILGSLPKHDDPGRMAAEAPLKPLHDRLKALELQINTVKSAISRTIKRIETEPDYYGEAAVKTMEVDLANLVAKLRRELGGVMLANDETRAHAALEVARLLAKWVDEEQIHFLTFDEKRFPRLEVEGMVGAIFKDVKHPFRPMLLETLNERFPDRSLDEADDTFLDDDNGFYTLGAELLRKMIQKQLTGTTSEDAVAQANYLAAAMAADLRAGKMTSKGKPSLLQTIGALLRRYSERMRSILGMRWAVGQLPEGQYRLFHRLMQDYRKANLRGDVDLAREKLVIATATRLQLHSSDMEERLNKIGRKHTEGLDQIKRLPKVLLDIGQEDFLVLNAEGELTLHEEVEKFIKRNPDKFSHSLIYDALEAMQSEDGYQAAWMDAALARNVLEARELAFDFNPAELLGDSSTFDPENAVGKIIAGSPQTADNPLVRMRRDELAAMDKQIKDRAAGLLVSEFERVENLDSSVAKDQRELFKIAMALGWPVDGFFPAVEDDFARLKERIAVHMEVMFEQGGPRPWEGNYDPASGRLDGAVFGGPLPSGSWKLGDETAEAQPSTFRQEQEALAALREQRARKADDLLILQGVLQRDANGQIVSGPTTEEVPEADRTAALWQLNKDQRRNAEVLRIRDRMRQAEKDVDMVEAKRRYNQLVDYLEALDEYNRRVTHMKRRAIGDFYDWEKSDYGLFWQDTRVDSEKADNPRLWDKSDPAPVAVTASDVFGYQVLPPEATTGEGIKPGFGHPRNPPKDVDPKEAELFRAYDRATKSNAAFRGREWRKDFMLAQWMEELPVNFDQQLYTATGGFRFPSIEKDEFGRLSYETSEQAFPGFDGFDELYAIHRMGEENEELSQQQRNLRDAPLWIDQFIGYIDKAERWLAHVQLRAGLDEFDTGPDIVREMNGNPTLAAQSQLLLDPVLEAFGDRLAALKKDFLSKMGPHLDYSAKENFRDSFARERDKLAPLTDETQMAKAFLKMIKAKESFSPFKVTMEATQQANTAVKLVRRALHEFSNLRWQENLEKEMMETVRDLSYTPEHSEFLRLRDTTLDPATIRFLEFNLKYISQFPDSYHVGAGYAYEFLEQHRKVNKGGGVEPFMKVYLDSQKRALAKNLPVEINEEAQVLTIDDTGPEGQAYNVFASGEQGADYNAFTNERIGNSWQTQQEKATKDANIAFQARKIRLSTWLTLIGFRISESTGNVEDAKSFRSDVVRKMLTGEGDSLELIGRGIRGMFSAALFNDDLHSTLVEQFLEANPHWKINSRDYAPNYGQDPTPGAEPVDYKGQQGGFDAEAFAVDLLEFKESFEREVLQSALVNDKDQMATALATVLRVGTAGIKDIVIDPKFSGLSAAYRLKQDYQAFGKAHQEKYGVDILNADKQVISNVTAEEAALVAQVIQQQMLNGDLRPYDARLVTGDLWLATNPVLALLAGSQPGSRWVPDPVKEGEEETGEWVPVQTLIISPDSQAMAIAGADVGFRVFPGSDGMPDVIWAPLKPTGQQDAQFAIQQLLQVYGEVPTIKNNLRELARTIRETLAPGFLAKDVMAALDDKVVRLRSAEMRHQQVDLARTEVGWALRDGFYPPRNYRKEKFKPGNLLGTTTTGNSNTWQSVALDLGVAEFLGATWESELAKMGVDFKSPAFEEIRQLIKSSKHGPSRHWKMLHNALKAQKLTATMGELSEGLRARFANRLAELSKEESELFKQLLADHYYAASRSLAESSITEAEIKSEGWGADVLLISLVLSDPAYKRAFDVSYVGDESENPAGDDSLSPVMRDALQRAISQLRSVAQDYEQADEGRTADDAVQAFGESDLVDDQQVADKDEQVADEDEQAGSRRVESSTEGETPRARGKGNLQADPFALLKLLVPNRMTAPRRDEGVVPPSDALLFNLLENVFVAANKWNDRLNYPESPLRKPSVRKMIQKSTHSNKGLAAPIYEETGKPQNARARARTMYVGSILNLGNPGSLGKTRISAAMNRTRYATISAALLGSDEYAREEIDSEIGMRAEKAEKRGMDYSMIEQKLVLHPYMMDRLALMLPGLEEQRDKARQALDSLDSRLDYLDGASTAAEKFLRETRPNTLMLDRVHATLRVERQQLEVDMAGYEPSQVQEIDSIKREIARIDGLLAKKDLGEFIELADLHGDFVANHLADAVVEMAEEFGYRADRLAATSVRLTEKSLLARLKLIHGGQGGRVESGMVPAMTQTIESMRFLLRQRDAVLETDPFGQVASINQELEEKIAEFGELAGQLEGAVRANLNASLKELGLKPRSGQAFPSFKFGPAEGLDDSQLEGMSRRLSTRSILRQAKTGEALLEGTLDWATREFRDGIGSLLNKRGGGQKPKTAKDKEAKEQAIGLLHNFLRGMTGKSKTEVVAALNALVSRVEEAAAPEQVNIINLTVNPDWESGKEAAREQASPLFAMLRMLALSTEEGQALLDNNTTTAGELKRQAKARWHISAAAREKGRLLKQKSMMLGGDGTYYVGRYRHVSPHLNRVGDPYEVPVAMTLAAPQADRNSRVQSLTQEQVSKQKQSAEEQVRREFYVNRSALNRTLQILAVDRIDAHYKLLRGELDNYSTFDPSLMVNEAIDRVRIADAVIKTRHEQALSDQEQAASRGMTQEALGMLLEDHSEFFTGEPVLPAHLQKHVTVAGMKRRSELRAKVNRLPASYEARNRLYGTLYDNGTPIVLMAQDARQRLMDAFPETITPRNINRTVNNMVLRALANAPAARGKPAFMIHTYADLSGQFTGDFELTNGKGLNLEQAGKAFSERISGHLQQWLDGKRGKNVALTGATSSRTLGLFKSLVEQLVHVYGDPRMRNHKGELNNTGKKVEALLRQIDGNGFSADIQVAKFDLIGTFAEAFAETEAELVMRDLVAGLVTHNDVFMLTTMKILHHSSARNRIRFNKTHVARETAMYLQAYLERGFDGESGREGRQTAHEEQRARLSTASKKISSKGQDKTLDQSLALVVAQLDGLQHANGLDPTQALGEWYEAFKAGYRQLKELDKQQGKKWNGFERFFVANHVNLIRDLPLANKLAEIMNASRAMDDFGLVDPTSTKNHDEYRNDESLRIIAQLKEALLKASTDRAGTEHYAAEMGAVLLDAYNATALALAVMSKVSGPRIDTGIEQEDDASVAWQNREIKPWLRTYGAVPIRLAYATNPGMLEKVQGREGKWIPDPADTVAITDSSFFGGLGKKETNRRSLEVLRPMSVNGLSAPLAILDDAIYRLNVAPNYEVLRRLTGKVETQSGVPEVGDSMMLNAANRNNRGIDDQDSNWRFAMAAVASEIESNLFNDARSGVLDTAFAEATSWFSAAFIVRALSSVQQLWDQTASATVGFVLKKVLTGQAQVAADFIYAVAHQIGSLWSGEDGFSRRLSRFTYNISPYIHFRGVDGMDLARNELSKQVRYGGNVVGRWGGRALKGLGELGDTALNMTIGKAERIISRAIFAAELMSELRDKMGDRAPANIDDMIDTLTHKDIPLNANRTALEKTSDMMGQADPAKKGLLFQSHSDSPILSSVIKGLVQFSNHPATTASNLTAFFPALGSKDKRTRREAQENFIGTLTQNMLFPILKWKTLLPLAAYVVFLIRGDDDDEAARKAQKLADDWLTSEDDSPMVGFGKDLIFGSGSQLFSEDKTANAAQGTALATIGAKMGTEVVSALPLIGVFNGYLPASEAAKWLITNNIAEFWASKLTGVKIADAYYDKNRLQVTSFEEGALGNMADVTGPTSALYDLASAPVLAYQASGTAKPADIALYLASEVAFPARDYRSARRKEMREAAKKEEKKNR